jgi:arsenate reductase
VPVTEDRGKLGPVTRPAGDLLFLCVANSARSQIAEGWARHLAPRGRGVHSAGSEPGSLNPYAVEVMAEVGIDISGHVSKPVSAVPLDRIGTVVTLCADELCPVLPGEVVRLHWPLPDPVGPGTPDEQRARFRAARDEIERRVRALLAGG